MLPKRKLKRPLLDDVSIPTSQRGRPRKRCKCLLPDKGYAEAVLRYCDRYRMQPVIPLRSMTRKPKPGLTRLFDRPQVPPAQYHRAHVRLAEREPPYRQAFRQTCKKLRRYGSAGMFPAVSATFFHTAPSGPPCGSTASLAHTLCRQP